MNFRLIAIMAAAALTVSATTGADAAKRRSAAKKKTTACAAGYPHFYLQNAVIKNVLTPKSFSLNGPVKTLRTINPIYDGQYQERTGAIGNYTFDTEGKPLSICNDNYGDAAGWDRYYISYDADGNFESIKVDIMEGTQDPFLDDQSIKANYSFDYAGDKITRITEQTTSVWGKPVSWKPFHYTVVYTTDGRIKQVTCEEDPRVSFTFNNKNQFTGKRFVNYMKYNEQTYKCTSAWKLETFEDFGYYNNEETEDSHGITTINDHYRNWIQRSWKSDYSGEEWGEFREITYYE